jgi:hypothetical protein
MNNTLQFLQFVWISVVFACLGSPSVSQRRLSLPSPVVHADKSVTFNMHAPDTEMVELNTQFIRGNRPLQKGQNGIWSVTLVLVGSNLYSYTFRVDRVSALANLDQFASFGTYATYLTPDVATANFGNLVSAPDQTNSKITLLLLEVAQEDFPYATATKLDSSSPQEELSIEA